jgi:hypothetical protein
VCIFKTNKKVWKGSRVAQSVQWLGYGLDDQGKIPSTGNEGIFLFATTSMLALRSTQPSLLSSGYCGALPLGVKWLGQEADHSPLTGAEFKDVWNYTSTHVFMAQCLISKGTSSWCGAWLCTGTKLYIYLYESLKLWKVHSQRTACVSAKCFSGMKRFSQGRESNEYECLEVYGEKKVCVICATMTF